MLYLYHRQIKYKDKEHINVIINYASESRYHIAVAIILCVSCSLEAVGTSHSINRTKSWCESLIGRIMQKQRMQKYICRCS